MGAVVGTSLSRADLPTDFLILGALVVVVAAILFLGVLVEVERERQHARRRGR